MDRASSPLFVRTAAQDDVLAHLWPDLDESGFNRQQVLVVVDQQTEALVGGLVLWDAGHDCGLVTDLALIAPDSSLALLGLDNAMILDALARAVVAWFSRRSIQAIGCLVPEERPDFVRLLEAFGGETVGACQYVSVPIPHLSSMVSDGD